MMRGSKKGRFFISNILATATVSKALAARPYTVSVGIATHAAFFSKLKALGISVEISVTKIAIKKWD